jgi:hypothetical protein
MHSIDFIDEYHFIENRTFFYDKRFLLKVIHLTAKNILRKAVRGSLDARK